ncbi:hypothetical protein [Nocardioides sp. CFH 31398]|uniref:hypothetical protein n=1 Tax=Nocardioides sp. CFH 31398 TaxID=2919579 RepID=UPI001F06017A|nr:hypothetical protein [Nocardioides sp. CFH 31398]MCH1868690.1 hypothetical protein [Nocardioides sp. CFH 31398]
MNEPVSPQRRRPPGWRAARRAPEETDDTGAATTGQDSGPDTAFGRGETVERPVVRLPAEDRSEDDQPVLGARREDDRTRTMSAVESERYRADPVEERLSLRRRTDGDAEGEGEDPDDEDLDEDDSGEAHPVAVPLAGFFAGMAYILVLPVLYVWLSNPDSLADVVGVDLVWLVAVILVPLFLTAIPQTRKFGRYMLLGVGLSAVVVVGVAAVVLAVLIFLL